MSVNITGPDGVTDEVASAGSPGNEPVAPSGVANGGGTGDAAPGSMLSRLRKQADEQQKDKFQDFPVGGEFGDMLQIRYKPLKPDELDDFINRQTDQTMSKVVAIGMDMMARSCIGVFTYDPETGVKEELLFGGNKIGLDNRLMQILEIPQPHGAMTSREVITLLFGYNGPAIAGHADKVATWMQDPKASVGSESVDPSLTQ